MTSNTNSNTASKAPAKPQSPIIKLLVALGRTQFKEGKSSAWPGMEELASLCKEHNINLGVPPLPQDLEKQIRALGDTMDELYADGVNVVWNDNRVEWDLVFQVRFYPYQQGTSIQSTNASL